MTPGGLFSNYLVLSAVFSQQLRLSQSSHSFPESDRFIEKVIQHEIVVREGEDTRIPCDIQPGAQESAYEMTSDRPTLIIWYKKDQNVPIYSLDLRQYGAEHTGVHWRNHNTTDRGRIHYEEKGKVRRSHLFLPTVTREDGGKYRCRVDYMKLPTKNSWVKLKVIVGPSKPVLKDQAGSIIDGSILVQQGVSITIHCFTKGIPLPSLLWKLGGKPLQPVAYNTDLMTGVVESQVRLDVVGEDHHGSRLECQASNSDRASEPVVSWALVRPIAPPADVQILRQEQYFRVGRRYNISCLVSGVEQEPVVFIAYNNLPLNLYSVQVESTGDWLATAKFHPTQEMASQGFHARKSSNTDRQSSNAVLKIRDSSDLDGGVECRAANPLLPDHILKDSWNAPIHYGPHVQLYIENKEAVHEGEDVFFKCKVFSYPPYQTIQWYRQNEDLEYKTEPNVFIEADRLYIRAVSVEQAGSYVCRASNPFTSQRSNVVDLIVIAPLRVDLRDCMTLNQSSSSFLVDCSWDAEPVYNSFIIELYKWNMSSLVLNVSSESPRLLLSDLSPSTDFTVYIKPGRPDLFLFPPVLVETLTLPAEEKMAATTVDRESEPGYVRLLPMIGILLGLLLVLSVLPVTVHLLVRRRVLSQMQQQVVDAPEEICLQRSDSREHICASRPMELEYKCLPSSSNQSDLDYMCTMVTPLTPPPTFTSSTFKTSSTNLSHSCTLENRNKEFLVQSSTLNICPSEEFREEKDTKPILKSILKERSGGRRLDSTVTLDRRTCITSSREPAVLLDSHTSFNRSMSPSTIDRRLDSTGTIDRRLNSTSTIDIQLNSTGAMDRRLDSTSTIDRKLDSTSTIDRRLDSTGTIDKRLNSTGTIDRRLDFTSTIDRRFDSTGKIIDIKMDSSIQNINTRSNSSTIDLQMDSDCPNNVKQKSFQR